MSWVPRPKDTPLKWGLVTKDKIIIMPAVHRYLTESGVPLVLVTDPTHKMGKGLVTLEHVS